MDLVKLFRIISRASADGVYAVANAGFALLLALEKDRDQTEFEGGDFEFVWETRDPQGDRYGEAHYDLLAADATLDLGDGAEFLMTVRIPAPLIHKNVAMTLLKSLTPQERTPTIKEMMGGWTMNGLMKVEDGLRELFSLESESPERFKLYVERYLDVSHEDVRLLLSLLE